MSPVTQLQRDTFPSPLHKEAIVSSNLTAFEIRRESRIRSLLQALKSHHLESYEHSLRVTEQAVLLGSALALPMSEIRALKVSALLHDVGKLCVCPSILSKTTCLTEQEFGEIKKHPRAGFELLDPTLFERERRIMVGHHEYKRAPYPRNPSHADPDFSNRRISRPSDTRLTEVIAAADMYDALTSARSYKPGFSPEKAIDIMREEFTGDPHLIVLLESLGRESIAA